MKHTIASEAIVKATLLLRRARKEYDQDSQASLYEECVAELLSAIEILAAIEKLEDDS